MTENVSVQQKQAAKRGRPKGSKDKNPGSRPSTVGKKGTFEKGSLQPTVKPGDNARYLRFALEGYHLPPIDIAAPKQVEDRINYYFKRCFEDDQKPGVAGLCNYLGIDRMTWYSWSTGAVRAGTHYDIAKKTQAILETMWESYFTNGKLNPVSGIFIAKNHFGYQDRTEVVQVQKDPLAEGASPAEIANRYAQAVVAEDPEPLPIRAEESAERAEGDQKSFAQSAEQP